MSKCKSKHMSQRWYNHKNNHKTYARKERT